MGLVHSDSGKHLFVVEWEWLNTPCSQGRSQRFIYLNTGKECLYLQQMRGLCLHLYISTSWLWDLRLIDCIVSSTEPKATKHEVSSHHTKCLALTEKKNPFTPKQLFMGVNSETINQPTEYHCSCSKSKTHCEIIYILYSFP